MTAPHKMHLSETEIAPNGKTFGENFSSWFGSSKVTDEAGDPLRVYHATTHEFDALRPGGINPRLSGNAIWFTPNAHRQPAAHNIGRAIGKFNEGTRVLPAFVRIERPLMIDQTTLEWSRALYGSYFPQFIDENDLKEIKQDYDGILYFQEGKLEEVVVFDSKQAKSAIGNNGNFDKTSSSLTDHPPSTVELRAIQALVTINTAENTSGKLVERPKRGPR